MVSARIARRTIIRTRKCRRISSPHRSTRRLERPEARTPYRPEQCNERQVQTRSDPYETPIAECLTASPHHHSHRWRPFNVRRMCGRQLSSPEMRKSRCSVGEHSSRGSVCQNRPRIHFKSEPSIVFSRWEMRGGRWVVGAPRTSIQDRSCALIVLVSARRRSFQVQNPARRNTIICRRPIVQLSNSRPCRCVNSTSAIGPRRQGERRPPCTGNELHRLPGYRIPHLDFPPVFRREHRTSQAKRYRSPTKRLQPPNISQPNQPTTTRAGPNGHGLASRPFDGAPLPSAVRRMRAEGRGRRQASYVRVLLFYVSHSKVG